MATKPAPWGRIMTPSTAPNHPDDDGTQPVPEFDLSNLGLDKPLRRPRERDSREWPSSSSGESQIGDPPYSRAERDRFLGCGCLTIIAVLGAIVWLLSGLVSCATWPGSDSAAVSACRSHAAAAARDTGVRVSVEVTGVSREEHAGVRLRSVHGTEQVTTDEGSFNVDFTCDVRFDGGQARVDGFYTR